MLKQLRIRFICITMSIVTVMMCIVFGMLLTFTHAGLEQESMMLMEAVAEDPTHTYRPNDTSAESRIPYFTLQVNNAGIMIISNGGSYDLSDQEFLQQLIRVVNSGDQTGVLRSYNLRYYQTSTPNSLLVVFADTTAEQNTMYSLIRTCICIGAASLLAFFFLSLLLARWAIHPVEQTWKIQKQFVADASHELKTPLTVILTDAELLASSDYDAETKSRLVRSINTMAQQMRGLVESLLELARIDDGVGKKAWETFDFSDLVEDAALPFEALFFEKDLLLDTEIAPGMLVKGNKDQLRQVVEIFLDNAQKYASGGTVTVSLTRSGRKHCTLSVADEGAPIAPEDLKNIFKRFYRTDKVRSMNHSYGLGLSIAESIVTEHHGKIWAESSGGLNTFFVTLPLENEGINK